MVLRMTFLILNNANIKFAQKKSIWRSYIIVKALSTIKQMEIINKKNFAKLALDEHNETFITHVTFLLMMAIYPVKKAQITLLITEKI